MNPFVYAVLLLQTAQQVQSAGMAFRAGSAYFAKGDLAHAHAEFARVVQLTPRVAAGHSAYGTVLLAEGNPAAALPELELAHRLDGTDDTTTLALATAYSQQRQYDEALATFSVARPSALLSPEETVAWATALTATGHLDAAADRLREAVNQNQQSAPLHDALGTVLAQQQRFDEAHIQFEAAIALDASSASAHMHLGSLYLLQQHVPAALTELNTAATLTPDDLQTLLQLGRAQTAARQEDIAIATLTRAHQLTPASPDAAYALAVALQNAGRSKESLPLFSAAAAARPDDASILTNYGLALVQTGDARQALPLYERALRIDQANPVLYEDIGVAYLQQSDLDHAIREFQAGLALRGDGAPLTAELHYDLGLALKLQDKLPEAIAQFQMAEQKDPTLPDPPYTLGVLYMQTGKLEEAATEMEKATAMRPEKWRGMVPSLAISTNSWNSRKRRLRRCGVPSSCCLRNLAHTFHSPRFLRNRETAKERLRNGNAVPS